MNERPSRRPSTRRQVNPQSVRVQRTAGEQQRQNRRNNFIVQGSLLAIASIIVRIIGMVYRVPLTAIIGDEGNGYYTADIRWWRVKEYLFRGLVILVLFSMLIIRLVTYVYTAKREKTVIAQAGWMIGDYMKHDREAGEVFPPEYAEISVSHRHDECDPVPS